MTTPSKRSARTRSKRKQYASRKRIKSRPRHEVLQESEARYRDLFESSRDAITINTLDGRFVDVNQAWLDLFGYPRQEMLRLNAGELYADPDDRVKFQQKMDREGFVKDFEVKLRRKDGAVRDCLLTSTAWRDEEGHILGYQGIVHDHTERNRRQREIRTFSHFLEEMARNLPDLVFIKDKDLKYVLVSDAACDFAGKSRHEMLGRTAHDIYSRNLADSVEKTDREVLEKGTAVEIPELSSSTRDGRTQVLETRKAPLKDSQGNVTHVISITRDVTERKKMEETLRRSEEKFRRIFQSSPNPYIITLPEGPILDVNDAWVRMSGYTREEAIGHSTIELNMILDPKERDQIMEDLLQKRRLSNIEMTRSTKSGELRHILNTVELVELDNRTCILNMQVDITERRHMEDKLKQYSEHLEELVEEKTRELRDSEEKFRHMYDASLNAIYTTSLEGRWMDMNPAGISMFGYDSYDDFAKLNVQSLYVNPEDRKKFIQLASQGPVRGFETQFRRKDGKIIDALVNSYALRDEEDRVTGFQGAIIDITERKQMEKMRDEFVADVTDELLIPLVSIKGYVDYILKEKTVPLPDEVTSSLNVVNRSADRLLALTNDLVDIRRAKLGKLQLSLEPLDFRIIVEQCIAETQPTISKKQTLRLEVLEGPLPIHGDRARLSKVLTALLSNAAKFAPEGEIALCVNDAGNDIQVEVSDTGAGIKKENLERVFEPFSAIQRSTYVKGAGLSLSISKGTVEAHGGRIWAESEGEEKGAKFTFTLPKRA